MEVFNMSEEIYQRQMRSAKIAQLIGRVIVVLLVFFVVYKSIRDKEFDLGDRIALTTMFGAIFLIPLWLIYGRKKNKWRRMLGSLNIRSNAELDALLTDSVKLDEMHYINTTHYFNFSLIFAIPIRFIKEIKCHDPYDTVDESGQKYTVPPRLSVSYNTSLLPWTDYFPYSSVYERDTMFQSVCSFISAAYQNNQTGGNG